MLVTLIALYLLLVAGVMLLQRRMIYFPTRLSEKLCLQLGSQDGFQPWRNERDELIGWHLPARAESKGSVLIVHGNGGCAAQRGYFAKPIHDAAPVDVYVLEYPGYGARAGAPTKDSLLHAAQDAFSLLKTNQPIYIVSESLGAGSAAYLAERNKTKVSGLAMFAPYNKLASVAQHQMRLLPAALMLWDRFNPAESLKDYRGPLKVVLAEADTIIPAKFGQRLYDSYGGPKSVEVVRGAGHNEIAEQSPEWWKRVFAFWEQHQSGN